jgi:hypothetical protein
MGGWVLRVLAVVAQAPKCQSRRVANQRRGSGGGGGAFPSRFPLHRHCFSQKYLSRSSQQMFSLDYMAYPAGGRCCFGFGSEGGHRG